LLGAKPNQAGRIVVKGAIMPHDDAEFWSTISEKYDCVVDAQLGKNLRNLVRDRLSQEANLGRTLEVGCGSGKFTRVLAERADSVVATDIAPGMLEVARSCLRDKANVTFQIADCMKLSFDQASFDTAFLALVLQFVDAEVALAELYRVIKPGGLLIVANLDVQALSFPFAIMLIARTMYYAKKKYSRSMPRITPKRMLSARQLREKLEAAGFRVERSEPIRDRSCIYNCPIAYVRALKV
jgi:ABC-2 type transport system ATP-binding protein